MLDFSRCTDVQNVSSICPTLVNGQSVTLSSDPSEVRDIAMLEHCEVQLVEWTAREQRERAEEAGRAELANSVQGTDCHKCFRMFQLYYSVVSVSKL